MTKGSIQEEDITIINIYAPNIEASQYIRQTLTDIKGEIDRNTIIVDLNTPLTPVNRSSKHKSNNQTRLKWYIRCDGSHWHLQAIPSKCRRIHFLSAHGTFSRIDHILGHKSNLSKVKKIEIVSNIFCNNNAMRLDINFKKNTVRNTNTWRLNNTFPNNQQLTEEIKREIKTFLETNYNENITTQNLWDAAKAERGKFIAI